jgi:hypothetical protein
MDAFDLAPSSAKTITNPAFLLASYLQNMYTYHDQIYDSITNLFLNMTALSPRFVPTLYPKNLEGVEFAVSSRLSVAYANYLTVLQAQNQVMNEITNYTILIDSIRGPEGVYTIKMLDSLRVLWEMMVMQDDYRKPDCIQQSINFLTSDQFENVNPTDVHSAIVNFSDALARFDIVPTFERELVIENLSLWLNIESIWATLTQRLVNANDSRAQEYENKGTMDIKLQIARENAGGTIKELQKAYSSIVIWSRSCLDWLKENASKATIIGNEEGTVALAEFSSKVIAEMMVFEDSFIELLMDVFQEYQVGCCNNTGMAINDSFGIFPESSGANGAIRVQSEEKITNTMVEKLAVRISAFEMVSKKIIKMLNNCINNTRTTQRENFATSRLIVQAEFLLVIARRKMKDFIGNTDERAMALGAEAASQMQLLEAQFITLRAGGDIEMLKEFIIQLNTFVASI